MSTSANVTEYTIYKGDEQVGTFRKNWLCRLPEFSDLLKYLPLADHEVVRWGYDEEEDYWEEEPENLETFLRECKLHVRKIRDHFDDLDLGLCECGGQPYVDRCPIAGPIPYWVACNCGKTGISELNRDKAIENWNNNILHDESDS